MRRALDELALVGVATNQAFHRRLLADPAFQEGDIDIQFLERRADLVTPALAEAQITDLAIAAALAEDAARRSRKPAVADADHGGDGWARQARLESLQ